MSSDDPFTRILLNDNVQGLFNNKENEMIEMISLTENKDMLELEQNQIKYRLMLFNEHRNRSRCECYLKRITRQGFQDF